MPPGRPHWQGQQLYLEQRCSPVPDPQRERNLAQGGEGGVLGPPVGMGRCPLPRGPRALRPHGKVPHGANKDTEPVAAAEPRAPGAGPSEERLGAPLGAPR